MNGDGPPAEPATRLAIAAALAVVATRCAVFVLYEQAHFDSDQAIVGLMAWHLAHLKAFPLFFYGQSYLLGVEAWLAAPVLLAAGPSVTALKLPVALLNLAGAGLLVRLLVRESGLGPWIACTTALFFLAAPPIPASRLADASGMNIEPFVFVLVLWMLRNRPAWFGAVLAVGFLNREFTIFAATAILAIGLADGTLRSREGIRRIVMAALAYGAVVAVVHGLTTIASNYDGGVRPPSVGNLGIDALFERLGALVGRMLPILFGARVDELQRFNVSSRLVVGHAWLGAIMTAAGASVTARLMYLRRRTIGAPTGTFPVYLVLVGLQSAAAYLLLPAGGDDMQFRYVLLALLLPIGLTALYLTREPRPLARYACLACVLVWAVASVTDHARLIAEYQMRRPPNAYRDLADYLEGSGVRFGRAGYWLAYHVTFLSGERVIVDSTDLRRIRAYRDVVEANRVEAVDLGTGDAPCPTPTRLRQWFICRPVRPR